MKLVKCEMHKVALAALVLGVFSLSPTAHAIALVRHPAAMAPSAPAPLVAPLVADPGELDAADSGLELADSNDSSGMSLAKLRTISSGFALEIKGDMVVMNGAIPRKCAIGASFSMNSVPGVDGKPGQHQIKFVPGADCDKPSADKAMVKLSSPSLFGRGRSLPDNAVDGDICIAHSENGAASCDSLNIKYVSDKTKAAHETAEQQIAKKKRELEDSKRAGESRKAKEEAFIAKLNVLCKQGDFVGFGAEIEAAKAFLGDVTHVLAKIDGLKQQALINEMKKAKDIDTMKDAYQAYLDAAEAAGWDTDDATSTYADLRVAKMNEAVKDKGLSAEKRAGVIRDLASDLREIDLFDKKHKERIGAAYVDLAISLKEAADGGERSKYAEAEKYYQEAVQYGDNSMKVFIDSEIAKMYHGATEACLDDAKEKGKGFNTCDSLAKKEKTSIDAAIKAQSHVKGDGSLEALSGMKQEKIARFGQDGYAVNVSGYGLLNRAGGSYDATKYSDYTQAQQQIMMQRQMGATGGLPGSSGGGFFQ